MNKTTFDEFCHTFCDGLYEPRLPEAAQCTGYIMLKKMVVENIRPASLEEMERWEKAPTLDELTSAPDIKYLRFLHPLLRLYVVERWDIIKNMQI